MMISCKCYNLNDEFMILKKNLFEFIAYVLSLREMENYVLDSIICRKNNNSDKDEIQIKDRIYMIKFNEEIILSHKQVYSYNNFILYYLYSSFKYVDDCSIGPLVYNCDDKISFDMAIEIMSGLVDRYPYFEKIIAYFDENRHSLFGSEHIITKSGSFKYKKLKK